MKDQTYHVINPLVVTKGVVATLVGDHPHAGEDAALKSPVHRPEKVGKPGREEVEVSGGGIEKEGEEKVISNIGE